MAVVGPPAVAAELDHLPGDPLDARQASSASRRAVADRRPRGLRRLRRRDEPPVRRLGRQPRRPRSRWTRPSTASPLRADGRPSSVTDVKPLPPKDPNGTAAFYAMIAWVFGGYIASTLIGLIGNPRSRSRRRAAARIGALAGVSASSPGILSVVMLRAASTCSRATWWRCPQSRR